MAIGVKKTDAELNAQIDAGIKTNGNREITPPIHNSIEQNLVASKISKSDGGLVVDALLGYSADLIITDPRHFIPKKYVDDLLSSLANIFELLDGTNGPWTGNHNAGTFDLTNAGIISSNDGYKIGTNLIASDTGTVKIGSLTDSKAVEIWTGGIMVMQAGFADFLTFNGSSGTKFKKGGTEIMRISNNGTYDGVLMSADFINNSDGARTADLFARKLYSSSDVVVLDFAGTNAAIEVSSTTQGVLFPRMTTTQKLAISSPVEGTEVYDLTLHQKSYYNGTVWVNY